MKKHIANLITGCRILASFFLLFVSAFSVEFYILYFICGFSDMIDGTVARLTKSADEFGATIDTIADLTFVISSLIKVFPMLIIPQWLWIWIVAIVSIKIGNILWGYASHKRFPSLHTVANKITGLLLFLLPLTLSFIEFKYSSVVVCSVATFAAIQEGFYIATNRAKK